jgi:hypothetical protein
MAEETFYVVLWKKGRKWQKSVRYRTLADAERFKRWVDEHSGLQSKAEVQKEVTRKNPAARRRPVYAVVRIGHTSDRGERFESLTAARKYQKSHSPGLTIHKLDQAIGHFKPVQNPGHSAIPAKWTPATVSRKGGQIQIRMGGR